MPTYEYVCTDCGHQWEAQQRITEEALTHCPQCNHETAKRQVSGGNFILKGGGWYADLYSSAKPSKPAGSGGESKGESSGSSTGSTAPAKSEGSGSGGGAGGSGSGSGSGSSGSSAPSS